MSDANFTCFGSDVSADFGEVSVPVIAAISVISVLLNAFNILIFSKKKMVSPTNTILLGIAASDLIKVLMFLVTSVIPMGQVSHSYSYQAFYLFCNVAMYLMHAFALWCGVLLALFRFFYLRYYASSRTKVWFSLARARLAVCLAFLANLLAVAPYAGSLRITGSNVTGPNATAELLEYGATLDTKHEFKIRMFNGLAQKVLPCLIMTCFCFFIIKSLRQTEKRRESLVNLNSRSRGSDSNNRGSSRRGCESVTTSEIEAPQPLRKRPSGNSRKERRSRDHRRTTSFLLVIIVLYILYEIPMSLLNILEDPILNLVSVQCFFRSFIGMLNTLGLVNNSVNFVLYCFMSKQFREVFKQMFGLVRCLHPKHPGTAAAAAAEAARGSGRSPTAATPSDRGNGRHWERHRTDSSRSGGGGSCAGGGSLVPMSFRSHEDERSCCSVSDAPSNVFSDA